jgi:hypothetical protein
MRMAEENRDWAYRRIQGTLSNLGRALARITIAEILERHGIEPAPERRRKTIWKDFLTQHWELMVAADFFTVEVWTRQGPQRFMVLFFITALTESECPRREICAQHQGVALRAHDLVWRGLVA